ncbi:MAG: hypothetical protein A2X36_01995 [Elusimicrobia bacterium GWA2_69_24]|nr:MAG: hypothetical protein A2X36_01995 [Elusimicrobia bacterium GWA2_69_24]HBL16580.1 hypothetical protein [Elusimicrobiota bacterium]
MMKPLTAAVIALALAGSARAQVAVSDADFGAGLNGIFLQSSLAGKQFGGVVAQANEKARPARILENVMVAMYDAPGTGEKIVQFLRDNGAAVEFNTLAQGRSMGLTLVDLDTGKKRPAVYINPRYAKDPVSYRYLGVLIAKEASEFMLADFPDCAERSYMVSAHMAETFFELGGTLLMLPRFDAIEDQDATKTIAVWIENAPEPGVEMLKSRGLQTLAELQAETGRRQQGLTEELRRAATKLDAARTQDEQQALHQEIAFISQKLALAEQSAASLKKAAASFDSFKKYETEWLMSRGPLPIK